MLGLVGNTAYQLCFIVGLDLSRANQASLFAATTPLWTLIIGKIAGQDTVTPRTLAGVGLTVVGVVLLLSESAAGALAGQGLWRGDLLFLGSSFCWAAA